MTPDRIGPEGRFDAFANGEVLFNKKKNHLPAMGWNSWNAFGSGNTEALTKVMADKFLELGLKDLGYEYIILDDGCYKDKRVDGKLSNDEVKFPSGFRALADYIHEKGLKFGMYNDIGTNLCAGAEVGTCIIAILSSLGANKNGKRTALMHLYFNVIKASSFMIIFYALNAALHFAFMNG